jgi:hypothetical protein
MKYILQALQYKMQANVCSLGQLNNFSLTIVTCYDSL